MRARLLMLAALALCAAGARAQTLPPEEQAFLRQKLERIVQVEPSRVTDADVLQVFAIPVYDVRVVIHQGESGTSTSSVLVGRVADSLVYVERPTGDEDRPDIARMFRGDFKLTGPAAAETLQRAFDRVYPIFTDDDKSVRKFRRAGNEWTFVRGKFFDELMGFVLTTDASGSITGVKYVLKLPS